MNQPNGTQVQWRVVSPAAWPSAPKEMSVSTQAEIDECPRRWALSTAEYPELWGGRGYPPRLQVATLAGSVVHLALEVITLRLVQAGVPSQAHPLATQVLRDMGGFTKVVRLCLDRVLARFAENPRAIALLDHARETLLSQVPALRTRVQSTLARLRIPRSALTSPPTTRSPAALRSPLTRGVYPEVELRARKIGWKGKVDLLVLTEDTCEITDFKTGAADEGHKFQIRVYAVLWLLDEELNPASRGVHRLVLAYESRDIDVPPPSGKEFESLAQELVDRKRAAEAAVATRPPVARPSVDGCRYCSVRQLCDEYWTTTVPRADPGFGDVELKIVRRHGETSWDAIVLRSSLVPADSIALLRLQQPTEFPVGATVRVLDGALARDPEDRQAPLIVTLGQFSETYRVQ